MNHRDHKKKSKSGSLRKSEPEFLVTGKLRKTHGLKGEMWVEVLSDVLELLDPEREVFIGDDFLKVVIKSFRTADKLGLICFKSYETPESLAKFNNQYLYTEAKKIPALKDGEYYRHTLIGIDVQDNDGNRIGKVADIIATGANDVYVIEPGDGSDEILIPAIESVISKIVIESNLMIVNLPEWDL